MDAENGYAVAAYVLMDVGRGAGLFATMAGPVAGKVGTTRTKIPWDSWDNYPKTVVDGHIRNRW